MVFAEKAFRSAAKQIVIGIFTIASIPGIWTLRSRNLIKSGPQTILDATIEWFDLYLFHSSAVGLRADPRSQDS
jgi:hypothetical protein